MKHLLGFMLLGLCLFVAKRGLEAHKARPRLVVTVPARASEVEVEQAIERALLTNLALSTDAARVDPIVREQLVRAMRTDHDAHARDLDLVERALSLGLHHADPLVRDRLAFQGEQLLRARLPPETPSDAELARYLEAHAARYRVPERVSLRQVFLSRSLRGTSLEADAKRVRAALAMPLSPERERALSDPTILPLALQAADARELDARFGAGFGRAVLEALPGAFHGPIASAYGLHFVFVTERLPAALPALTSIRARVLADYTHDGMRARLVQALATLRTQYELRVRRSGS